MPYRRRRQVPKRKPMHTGRRATQRRARGTVSIVKRSMNPFPQRMIVQHKYSESVNLNIPIGGTTSAYNWNLNSIYDPNRSGVGHQPYGRDQYAGLYQKYRVIACHYNVSVDSTNSLQLFALPTNEIVTIATGAQARETPRCRYVHQIAGGNTKVLKGKVYLPSLLGRTRAQYMADEDCQAAVGSNPSELCVLNTGVALIADVPVGSTVPANIMITLTYIVEWFDPITQSQS